jgi:hypothetical protein
MDIMTETTTTSNTTPLSTTPSTASPATVKPAKKPRQGRTNLKPELIKKIVPLEKIAQGEEILLELNRHRFLTNQQIADLLFRNRPNQRNQPFGPAGAKDAADLSVIRLLVQGLIEKKMVWQMSNPYNRPLKPGEAPLAPAMVRAPVNILTREGAKRLPALLEARDLDDAIRWTSRLQQITDQNIAHELEINDVAIALRRSISTLPNMTMIKWLDDVQVDQLQRAGKTSLKGITPDGICLVEVFTGNHYRVAPLFLEVDRKTESIRADGGSTNDWTSKVVRYSTYLERDFRRDPLHQELGLTEDEIETLAAPRILTITPSPKRIESMVKATSGKGGRGAYLYAAKADVYGAWGNIMGTIWQSPMKLIGQKSNLRQVLETDKSGPTA